MVGSSLVQLRAVGAGAHAPESGRWSVCKGEGRVFRAETEG